MDINKFYGKSRKEPTRWVRPIPEGSDDSELSSDDDDLDEAYHPNNEGKGDSDDSSSSAETDLDDDQGASQVDGQPGPSTATHRGILWRQRPLNEMGTQEPAFQGIQPDAGQPKDPILYFRNIVDNDMMNQIVYESNRYSLQKDITKPLSLSLNELEQFIGMIFYMSVVKIPRLRMYWSPQTRVAQVADVMPLKRFEEIKSKLHFSNNDVATDEKLAKVGPLMKSFKEKVKALPKSEMLAVDEQIIPFKGKSSLKQYNPKKPKKWGYKMFVCSGVDGLIHDFEMYTGAIQVCEGQRDIGASGNIVLRLLQSVPRHVWHKVYVDNWFNSLPLQATLWKQGIACIGTVRVNRLKGCSFPTDKELKKNGRGATVLKTGRSEGVDFNAVKWVDNKSVTLLSTYAAVEPTKQVKRWDKKLKTHVDVECPSIIVLYNAFMGGVDMLDSLVALYRNPIRSKKWYHRIVFHIFDLVVVQSWLLYVRDCKREGIVKSKQHALLSFKLEIAQCLQLQNKGTSKKRGRPSLEVEPLLQAKQRRGPTAPVPALPIRTDNVSHFPLPCADKGRCKNPGCKGFSRIKCEKCNVYLCLTQNSNCFKRFHEA